ncbi:hypothetical protein SAMN02745823_03844 [Sporobacter termitidis DSM 10068]|uniref:DUF2971 domain-containing protein n=1 Tax=Sporobacter termitidis DSM 10068 TaxID=1123282 RepID=A0A1M5ZKA0_9FIRM|nr:hypothetical protein [Sporobacter termitidis]SHI24559.1 hypothetical protein SAMN02745823_03844 [Sporobacter termitidis DSM 10068]
MEKKPYQDPEINQFVKIFNKYRIYASNSVYNYDRLLHYCSMNILGCILNNGTFRCTSLNNVELNDQFEAKRKNVEEFAGSRFIACFSHCQYEIVPFWHNYGGKEKKRKVVLKIKNFSDNITDVICTDFCYLPSGKKLFFLGDDYKATVNVNGLIGKKIGIPPINTDFDLRTCIRSISLFDVKYLPLKDNVFTQDYLIREDGIIKYYDPTELGRHKTEHWDYEKETRLMCITEEEDFCVSPYIDLRITERFFENLEIVMCPWAEDGLYDEIHDIINFSPIPDSIKNSIKVVRSELHGQVL